MLPPKDPQEEKKHLQEYETMMKKARKSEAKKQKEIYRKKEEKDKKTFSAIHTWENDIIPHWKSRVKDKRTIQLWDQGVPPRCRKKVWRLKIGNDLNVTKSTFSECLRRVPQAVRTKDQPSQKIYDPTSITTVDTPIYNIRTRRRRTSSLDVLREQHEEQHRFDDHEDYGRRRSSMENRPSTSTYSYASESESHNSGTEENGVNYHSKMSESSLGGRSAMELDSNSTSHDNDDDIGLEDDDEDDDTSSQEDEGEHEDDDDKVLRDPSAINFLNKAIDEDIVRTLPSLCVFQVRNE
jgi:hypothetical protein